MATPGDREDHAGAAESSASLSPGALSVERWLRDLALQAPTIETLADGLCRKLIEIGCPIDRCHITFSVLHPLFEAEGVTWTPEDGTQSEGYGHQTGGRSDAWLRSPIRHMVANRIPLLRQSLASADAGAALERFPFFADLRDAGFADYVAVSQEFESFTGYSRDRDPETSVSGMVASFASRAPQGFSDEQVAILAALGPMLGLTVKVTVQRQIAKALAETYLGAEAGRQVLDGSIHLGDGVLRASVVLFADLRGSTSLAARIDHRRFLELVNSFFAAIGAGIEEEGGEIVSFLGDGALAIFPLDRFGEQEARSAAMRAVHAAFAAVDALNGRPSPAGEAPEELAFGVSLHVGDLLYGNIGVANRMTWSVLGQVVNEAARLQELTKSEGAPVLASAAFVERAPEPIRGHWRSLGDRVLRGLAEPMRIYALREIGSETAPL